LHAPFEQPNLHFFGSQRFPLQSSQELQVAVVFSPQIPLLQDGATTALPEHRATPLQVPPQQGCPFPPQFTHDPP
jgi:hypothetical protein